MATGTVSAGGGMNPEMAQAFVLLAQHLDKNGTVPGQQPMYTVPRENEMYSEWLNVVCSAGQPFPSRACKKASEIIASYPEKITWGKQLQNIKGVGKGTVKKVWS